MTQSSKGRHLVKSFLAGFFSLVFAFNLVFPFENDKAYADVRKADIVLGQTIDSRGLSVAQCPNIESEYVIVTGDDGTIYYERNSAIATPIASITKIMTALVAIEHASPDTLITVSERAANVGESSASLQAGDTLLFDEALKGLMVSSGNDAAIAIAESIGYELLGGSGGTTVASGEEAEQAFVDEMNKKAAELGLIDTHFTNAHGLDYGVHKGDIHSCAQDVATMAKTAMQNERFEEIVAMPEANIKVNHADGTQGVVTLETTNVLLKSFEGNHGIKTGHTDAAGYCFAGVTTINGENIYTVVLDAPDENTRFVDTMTLCTWLAEHNISYPLANSDQEAEVAIDGQTVKVPVVAEVAHDAFIDKTIDATLSDPDQTVDIFDLNGNINQTVQYDKVDGDVHVGDKVGTITFKQRNEELVVVDMIACEEVKAPDLFEGIGIWWDRFFRSLSGQQTVAQSVLINETPLVNFKNAA